MNTRPVAPAHISPDLFRQFRAPRRGTGNPDVMTNPVWTWLVESGLGAYSANKLFGGPSSMEAGPCWCFDRFGRSETVLPDGRVLKIAGEHEDFYDPDFYIYNDVVVFHADGGVEILGYSEQALPPTDFHTADLVGDRIVIIGNLGYRNARQQETQVLSLDTADFHVERIDAAGSGPGWLHKHVTEPGEDGASIIVRGGLIADARWPSLIENIDEWRLDLETWRWERLTNKKWPRFIFVRADEGPNHLHWLRDALWAQRVAQPDDFAERRAERLQDLGEAPRFDLLPVLYTPDVPHMALAKDECEYRVHRISVDGVTVRYVEGNHDVRLMVEGELPSETVERLRTDLLNKLQAIENASIEWVAITQD